MAGSHPFGGVPTISATDVGEPQPDGDYEHQEWGAFSDICEWASRQRRKAFGAREHPGSKCSREHEHHSRDQCTLRHGTEVERKRKSPTISADATTYAAKISSPGLLIRSTKETSNPVPERSISAKNPSKGPVTGGKLTIFEVEGLQSEREEAKRPEYEFSTNRPHTHRAEDHRGDQKEREEAKVYPKRSKSPASTRSARPVLHPRRSRTSGDG